MTKYMNRNNRLNFPICFFIISIAIPVLLTLITYKITYLLHVYTQGINITVHKDRICAAISDYIYWRNKGQCRNNNLIIGLYTTDYKAYVECRCTISCSNRVFGTHIMSNYFL